MESPICLENEYDIWHLSNDVKTPFQVKVAIMCGIRARWFTRWVPPNTPSTRLFQKYLTEAASADLDAANTIHNEQRSQAITKVYERWHVPELFKLKYTSLIMRQIRSH